MIARFARTAARARGTARYAIVPTISEIGPCQTGGTLGNAHSAARASARAAPMP